jgi:aerobic carbon-monoxide dehydrogenase medium subunit
MKMKSTQYFAPASVQEALTLLEEFGARATVVAGGTDVVTNMHLGKLKPEVIVYVGKLGLDTIEERGDQLVLGALTKIAAVADSSLLKKRAALLPIAASLLGHPATRNQATIGGNIMSASPAADMACGLLSLDAVLTVTGLGGERKVALSNFYEGYRQAARKPNELLTEISISMKDVRGAFMKSGRRKGAALAVVNVSCALFLDQSGKCGDVRIVLGAMAPTTMRATKAEALLRGKKITEELIGRASQAAVEQARPIDDGRATAWYRKKLAHVLVARALDQCIS